MLVTVSWILVSLLFVLTLSHLASTGFVSALQDMIKGVRHASNYHLMHVPSPIVHPKEHYASLKQENVTAMSTLFYLHKPGSASMLIIIFVPLYHALQMLSAMKESVIVLKDTWREWEIAFLQIWEDVQNIEVLQTKLQWNS